MSILPDAILLQRFLAGDLVALETIFERYESPLYQFLVGLLRDHHQAEDILQETFIKALRDGESIHLEQFRGWLYTVAYREAMQIKRRMKKQSVLDPVLANILPDTSLTGEVLVEQNDQARRVRELLDRLPKLQQEVIRARIYEGKRYREIAADLGCPLNTALARMHEGLKKLRSLWEETHA
jgi:RNA polymerase sigma-70 factor, ECF subfamily